jgi:hypothetical protein
MIPAPSGSHLMCLRCVKTYGKHFIDPKSSEFCPFFKSFLVRRKLPFFCQICSLPFSLRQCKKPRHPCPFEILEETLRASDVKCGTLCTPRSDDLTDQISVRSDSWLMMGSAQNFYHGSSNKDTWHYTRVFDLTNFSRSKRSKFIWVH